MFKLLCVFSLLKSGVSVSPSNRPGDQYQYTVNVLTGMRRKAGTTANVGMKIYGEDGSSNAFLLKSPSRPTLTQGSLDSFLINTSESVGDLTHIRLWHDNSGNDPAWYVKEIAIQDVQTSQVWFFLCECWLAVDSTDAQIDRVFAVSSREEMTAFKHLFLSKAKKNLTDSHLWFSIVWRPPQNHFTRVQRLSCCLSLLLCTMMVNAMWYKTDVGRYTEIKLGPFQFSWEQVSIGISSSLIVFPINLLLAQIFRQCRPFPPSGKNKISPKKTAPCCSHKKSKKSYSLKKSGTLTTVFQNACCSKSENGPSKLENSCTEKQKCSQESYVQNGCLPCWFVYVGWIVVICVSLSAATMTLLYGVSFGKKTSEQWLFSFFISIFQDIFVSQPLKILILSLFIAHILKKPEIWFLQNKQVLTESEDDLAENQSEQIKEPLLPAEKPSEEMIRRIQQRIKKEQQIFAVLLDIMTYCVFVFLVLLIAYGHKDSRAYNQSKAVRESLVDKTFAGRAGYDNTETFSKVSED